MTQRIVTVENRGIWRGAFYGITAASIWGSMYVVSDLVLEVVPAFTLLSMRIVLALLVLLPLYARQGGKLPGARRMPSLLLVGFVGIGISLGAQFVGTELSTAVNGALVTSASPAFVVFFAILILKEKLTLMRISAVVMASAGVLIILDPASADFRSDTFAGNVYLAIAALTWGLYSVLVRWLTLRDSMPAMTVTIFALFGGLLLSLPASLLEIWQRPFGMVSLEILLGVLYLGLICTAFALLLWNRAFALAPASVASLFFFAQPLSGALLAAVFLGQPMTAVLWLGGFMIALAVLLSLRGPSADDISRQAETWPDAPS